MHMETEIATASESSGMAKTSEEEEKNNVKLISLSIQFNTERKQGRLGM